MPYAPGISADNSGLTRGILHGSESIARGLERYQEKKAAEVQNGKFAEGIFKTNPEIQKRIGMSEDEFKALSAQDKIALSSGAIASIHNEVEQAKAESERAQAQLYRTHAAYYQGEDQQNAALGGALQRYTEAYQQEPEAAAPMPPGPLNGALAAMGGPGIPTLPPGAQVDQAPSPPTAIETALARHQRGAMAALSTPGLGGKGAERLAELLLKYAPKGNGTDIGIKDLGDGVKAYYKPGGQVEIRNDPKPPKPEKEHAENYPWLLSDDEKTVMTGLKAITDPKERDLAIATRTAVMRMTGKPDALTAALIKMMTGDKTPGPGEAPKANPKYNPKLGRIEYP